MQRIVHLHPGRGQNFVMALVGHHHAYLEVMAALAERGDAYDPRPEGMLAHARRLLHEHPPPTDKR